MTNAQTPPSTPRKPLLLWPGVVIVVLQWLAWHVVPMVAPEAAVYGLLAGVVGGGLGVLVWWLFFSRAPWFERAGAMALMVGAILVTKRVVHPSIANAGMGMMVYFTAIPVLGLALVAWAVASRHLAGGRRWASLIASIFLACSVFTLVRTGGISGAGDADYHWRWTPTPEERLLAQGGDEATALPPVPGAPSTETLPKPPADADGNAADPAIAKTPESATGVVAPALDESMASATVAPAVADTPAGWPGFRGADRDGVARGARIETDWSKSPPVELWRRPVGPGWSSFAVRGGFAYTQEQRGDHETVACYELLTGEPVWRHRDSARFWESNAGAGPRSTPTLSNGRVYTLGATGIVNGLDAATGALVWSQDAASGTGAELPGWGFTSSPLVIGDLVIVAASGRLAAYDAVSGKPRWFRPTGGGSYSSPHLMPIGGVPQVLLLNGTGVTSVAPTDGTVLWQHEWPGGPILQPAQTSEGDVLIATADMSGGVGTRRIAVANGSAGWTVEERWTSRALKPYFNDFVVHEGHAFGFDGSILACLDLANGQRKWKGGRYGNGQLILLPEQDLLLVLSEDGELALVRARPDQFTEVARVPAITGKTWNHPVLVGDILLVRNGEEMAAFRLGQD